MLDQLGQLLAPQQQMPAEPDPALKTEWDGWLQNPVNRSGLMSFGLQLMTGGWGGGGQQFAQALGAGVEAASGTEQMLKAEQNKKDAIQREGDEKEKDRQLRRDLSAEQEAGANKRAGMSAGTARQDAIYVSLVKAAEDKSFKLQSKIAEINADLVMSPEEKAAAAAPLQKDLERFSDPVGYAESVLGRRAGGDGKGPIAGEETSGISASLDGPQGAEGMALAPASGGALNPADLLAGLTPEKKAVFDSLPSASQQAFLAQLQAKGVKSASAGIQGLRQPQAQPQSSTLNWLLQNLSKGPGG